MNSVFCMLQLKLMEWYLLSTSRHFSEFRAQVSSHTWSHLHVSFLSFVIKKGELFGAGYLVV